jgi:hypothetical protein
MPSKSFRQSLDSSVWASIYDGAADAVFAFPAHIPTREGMLSWSAQPIAGVLRVKFAKIDIFHVHLLRLLDE